MNWSGNRGEKRIFNFELKTKQINEGCGIGKCIEKNR